MTTNNTSNSLLFTGILILGSSALTAGAYLGARWSYRNADQLTKGVTKLTKTLADSIFPSAGNALPTLKLPEESQTENVFPSRELPVLENKLQRQRREANSQVSEAPLNTFDVFEHFESKRNDELTDASIRLGEEEIGIVNFRGITPNPKLLNRYCAVSGEVCISGKQQRYELFALFEGKDPKGIETAKFFAENMNGFVSEQLSQGGLDDQSISRALQEACNQGNKEVKGQPQEFGEATALIVLRLNGDLWIASAGSSRAILRTRDGNVQQLSKDRKAGGINTPTIVKVENNEIQSEDHLILCSKGVVSKTSSQSIGNRVDRKLREKSSPNQVARDLVQRAYDIRSQGNLSAMVIPLTRASDQTEDQEPCEAITERSEKGRLFPLQIFSYYVRGDRYDDFKDFTTGRIRGGQENSFESLQTCDAPAASKPPIRCVGFQLSESPNTNSPT